jgi:hypothetical protein
MTTIKDMGHTSPQNWALQWGQSPTIRRAAVLHLSAVSMRNWQRFLGAMMVDGGAHDNGKVGYAGWAAGGGG